MVSEIVDRRLKKLHAECLRYNDNHTAIPLETRENFQWWFSATLKEFEDFAEVGMLFLGFKLSRMQRSIARYMQYGGRLSMVQAQRGEAKSTLAALYCIWLLIQTPSTRIMIVSAGASQSDDMSLLITRIIMNWSLLCWLRPDTRKGDRDSALNFDVHYSLKGIDKSASIYSIGITASLQGKRADFILADDIESQKNSATQTMRDTLLEQTKEFAAICINGSILYLGTPQSKDSVYRKLPQRGYNVRVWTGRYPTDKELERYSGGTNIAPEIMEDILHNPMLQTGGGIEGNKGHPTDPTHISEETLQAKELDYGLEGFALQYMLDTTLADEARTRIKLSDLIVYGGNSETVPEKLYHSTDSTKVISNLNSINEAIGSHKLYEAVGVSTDFIKFEHKLMVADPAGNGGDEIAFALGGATNSYIHWISVGGFAGGFSEDNIVAMIKEMLIHSTYSLKIERNTGAGAVTALFIAQLDKLKLLCDNPSTDSKYIKDICSTLGISQLVLKDKLRKFGVEDYFSTGQKELRILNTISPVTRRHKIVVHKNAIEQDWQHCLRHSPDKRNTMSAFYQIAQITSDRGSLRHDDRADCLQRLTQELEQHLAKDESKGAEQRKEADFKNWLDNPMGYANNGATKRRGRNTSGLSTINHRRTLRRVQ